MKHTTIICDECGLEVKSDKQYKEIINIVNSITGGKDVCGLCIKNRLTISFSTVPLGDLKCYVCNGKGKIKIKSYNDTYEMRPEYDYIECPTCKGLCRIQSVKKNGETRENVIPDLMIIEASRVVDDK